MDAARFHNALRIMASLEIDELAAAGAIDENWGTPEASRRPQLIDFRADPFTEALRMPDANFDRLFALIESHQPSRVTSPEARIRDDLTHLKALVAHWREDAAANLTPTTETLEAASWRIRDALENLALLSKAEAPHA